MYGLILFMANGIFVEGRFLGKILDGWMGDIQDFVRTRLPHLVVLALVALVLSRLLRVVTNRMIRLAERHGGDTVRIGQVRTLAGVVRTTGLAIVLAIVGLQVLEALGVNVGPLLTSAGVAGVAIGLAAQNLVKDMLNGAMILIEDQFNVGDVVTVAGLTGNVETMTLRKTTVRGGDGTLFVIPNSQITTVANQSVDFANATINVSVDFSADPDRVQEILTTVANEVRNEPEYKDLFLANPQVLGVDSMKGSQLIFPVVFKTKPTKQYGPMREFQRRVRLALEANHMLPGDPMRVFSSFGAGVAAGREVTNGTGAKAPDPTTLKPQESNPFTGEG
jgi:moderate conductance mechanosensitive channel